MRRAGKFESSIGSVYVIVAPRPIGPSLTARRLYLL
jgi:hypothetical protein